jgi:hypothetical protein
MVVEKHEKLLGKVFGAMCVIYRSTVDISVVWHQYVFLELYYGALKYILQINKYLNTGYPQEACRCGAADYVHQIILLNYMW